MSKAVSKASVWLPTSIPFCSLPEAEAHCFLSLHRGILMLRVSANVYIGSFFCH